MEIRNYLLMVNWAVCGVDGGVRERMLVSRTGSLPGGSGDAEAGFLYFVSGKLIICCFFSFMDSTDFTGTIDGFRFAAI